MIINVGGFSVKKVSFFFKKVCFLFVIFLEKVSTITIHNFIEATTVLRKISDPLVIMDDHYRSNYLKGDLDSLVQNALKKRIEIAAKCTNLRSSYMESNDKQEDLKAYLVFVKEKKDAKANEIQDLERLYAEVESKTVMLKLEWEKSVKELEENARLMNLITDKQAELEKKIRD